MTYGASNPPTDSTRGGRGHATFVFRLHLQLMPFPSLLCHSSLSRSVCAHLLFLLVSVPNMAASTFRHEQTFVLHRPREGTPSDGRRKKEPPFQ